MLAAKALGQDGCRDGLGGVKNGKLLALASQQFDVFLTADKNLPYQQNLAKLPLAVVVLAAYSNELPHLLPLIPHLDETLASLRPRSLAMVGTNSNLQ